MSRPEGGTPPFWIKAASDGDSSIDERVRKSAEEIWASCFRHARNHLTDEMVAAEVLERVAIQVSNRLRRDEQVGRNLRGYLMVSFVHEVGARAKQESRIQYRGLSADLERALHPVAPDFLARIDASLIMEGLMTQMSAEGRQLLRLRLLDFSWKEAAAIVRITEKQARSRFYYSLEKAASALLRPPAGVQAKGTSK